LGSVEEVTRPFERPGMMRRNAGVVEKHNAIAGLRGIPGDRVAVILGDLLVTKAEDFIRQLGKIELYRRWVGRISVKRLMN
jgi:hypothetical protein